MSVDRTKVLEAAQKHVAKGAFDKAIVELQKLVKADPNDLHTWLRIGDYAAKTKNKPLAMEAYGLVADRYAKQGFFLKVLGVHKQMLNVDPTRLDVQLKLAETYELLQLVSDALSTYEQVAAAYGRLGDVERMLQSFGKMVDLDPNNIPARIKYAEALSRAEKANEAADAFAAGAQLLKQQGRLDDYVKVVERLLFHREDIELARELAQMYLERRDGKRALAKLQIVFKADPRDVRTLSMLADAFTQLEQIPKSISVLREIARLHGDAGREDDRLTTLKRILQLDPHDQDARAAISAAQRAAQPQPSRGTSDVRRDLAPPPGAVVASRASVPPDELEELEEVADELIEEPELEGEDDGFGEDEEVDEAPAPTPRAPTPAPTPRAATPAPSPRAPTPAVAPRAAAPTAAPPRAAPATGGVQKVTQPGEVPAATAAAARPPAAGPRPFPGALRPPGGGLPPPGARAPLAAKAPVAPAAPAPIAARIEPSKPQPAVTKLASSPPGSIEQQVTKLLTECDVFQRYGLKQKVVDQLRRVLDLDPTHVDARLRLKDALVERGEIAQAIGELLVVADQLATENPDAATLYLEQARELDPRHPEVVARMGATGGAMTSGAPTSPPSAAQNQTPTAPPPPAGEDDEIFFVEESRAAVAVDLAALARAERRSSLPPTKSERPPVDKATEPPGPPDDDFADLAPPPSTRPPARRSSMPPADDALVLSGFEPLDEAGAPSERPPAPSIPSAADVPDRAPEPTLIATTDELRELAEGEDGPPAVVVAPPSEEVDLLAPISPQEFEDAPLRSQPTHVRTAADVEAEIGEVEEILEEADFFVAQGLVDDALNALRDALTHHPKHPLLHEKLRELEIEHGASSTVERMEASAALAAIAEQAEAQRAQAAAVFDTDAHSFDLHGDVPAAEANGADMHGAYDVSGDSTGVEVGGAAAEDVVDNSFELASKLAEAVDEAVDKESRQEGSDVLDVEQVFAQFKRGVEQQVAREDTDTHFDLGIAYKEMGLLTDAIGEFTLCTDDPRRECMAYTMIGLCHVERGDLSAAITAYRRGLEADQRSEREEIGLHFELGRSQEGLRDFAGALASYRTVKARDPKFPRIDERITAVESGKAAGPLTVEASADDIDAAFDDLIGKS